MSNDRQPSLSSSKVHPTDSPCLYIVKMRDPLYTVPQNITADKAVSIGQFATLTDVMLPKISIDYNLECFIPHKAKARGPHWFLKESERESAAGRRYHLELDNEQQYEIVKTLGELGFMMIGYAGAGDDRIVNFVNGPFVLAVSAEESDVRPVTELMLQPIAKPFTLHGLRFELLPFVMPMNQADEHGISAINSDDELADEAKAAGFTNGNGAFGADMWSPNLGLLLTGKKIFLDPGCILPKPERSALSLEEFWEQGDTEQHAHLHSINEQTGLNLRFGEWPSHLITKDKLCDVIESAGQVHRKTVEEGTPEPLCRIVKRQLGLASESDKQR